MNSLLSVASHADNLLSNKKLWPWMTWTVLSENDQKIHQSIMFLNTTNIKVIVITFSFQIQCFYCCKNSVHWIEPAWHSFIFFCYWISRWKGTVGGKVTSRKHRASRQWIYEGSIFFLFNNEGDLKQNQLNNFLMEIQLKCWL